MKPLFPLAVALALAIPAASSAQPPAAAPVQVAVGYGDLDLSAPGDAEVMLQRLDSAALWACGASRWSSLREVRRAVERSACYREGLADAVHSLDAPTVTSLYEAGETDQAPPEE